MKIAKTYGASHPMLVKQSGDPARGDWTPKALKPKKGKR